MEPEDGSKDIHPTHTVSADNLGGLDGLLYCTACGAWTAGKASMRKGRILTACEGQAARGSRGALTLRNIRNARHPATGAILQRGGEAEEGGAR